jgi:apolipoprotein N-acyltransferase
MQNLELWNSMMMIDHEGKITGVYDKAHLVPFGEFQPLRPYVPKEWMTPVGDTDFSWGQPSQVLNWDHLPPLLPLICYEAIFPEMAQSEAERPDWLLNVTNDAWFGLSTGPHQHFHMARMRSVEQGVPLVRVANTGISAVIDGYGRIRASLPLGTQGILDAALPKPLPTATLFAQYHKIILLLLAVGGMIFIFLTRRRPTY